MLKPDLVTKEMIALQTHFRVINPTPARPMQLIG